MNEQLSLFEGLRSNLPKYSLVLAAFPDNYTAEQISDLGKSLKETHGLRGKMRRTDHLHVSLPLPRNISSAPETGVENVSRVCKTVTAVTRPFEIRFDRAMSFRGGRENHPLVLVNHTDGNEGIIRLHGMLSAEFTKGLSATPKFVPHLTLLYDKEELAFKKVESVCWTVKEIVLVRSEVGATKYHRLEHWLFGG